jgi:hypothetical protein
MSGFGELAADVPLVTFDSRKDMLFDESVAL